MSGLEVVVRPVVLPNIRPAAPRGLAPVDDPEQGVAVLGGAGGRLIDLTRSFQSSVQRQMPQIEQERTYDVDKIYQEDEDGNINRDNFVKTERSTAMDFIDSQGNKVELRFDVPPLPSNIETIQTGQVRQSAAAKAAE